ATRRPLCSRFAYRRITFCGGSAIFWRSARGGFKDACHEFGLSYFLSERNHFRHFLEELVSREATLLFWLLHTHSTSYASYGTAKGLQMQPCRAAHFRRKRGISLLSAQRSR